jgi:hypothetical protein
VKLIRHSLPGTSLLLIPSLMLGASLVACGGGAGSAATDLVPQEPTGPVEVRRVPRDQVDLVEVGGIAPNDTVLRVLKGVARTLLLRHGPPDHAEFLELNLPATVFAEAGKDTILVTVTTRPGVYGVDLSADADWGPGTRLAFKYAVHFFPPSGSVRRYGTLTEVAKRLTIARRERNGDLTILYSTAPAPDVARAFVPGAGSYEMVVTK